MTSIRTLSSLVAISALCSLVACGGGGGGDSAPSPTPPAPAPITVNTVTVSSLNTNAKAVGDTLTLTWSNTSGESCVGAGLLSGNLAATGSITVTLNAEGHQSYSVSCGGTVSNVESFDVLPAMTPIADPVFEQALVDAGIDDVVDGQVATSKLLAVTKLAIMGGQGYAQAADVKSAVTGSKKITDLTGLANMRNLTYLRLENQAFTSIDVSALTQLQTLSVWQAPITMIDLSHNTALTTLGVSETSMTSIDLSTLVNLVEFDAQNAGTLPYAMPSGTNVQGFASVDFSHNTKLARVYLSYNRLTTVDFSHNPLLQQASLDHNLLTSVTGAPQGAKIDTSANPMTP